MRYWAVLQAKELQTALCQFLRFEKNNWILSSRLHLVNTRVMSLSLLFGELSWAKLFYKASQSEQRFFLQRWVKPEYCTPCTGKICSGITVEVQWYDCDLVLTTVVHCMHSLATLNWSLMTAVTTLIWMLLLLLWNECKTD